MVRLTSVDERFAVAVVGVPLAAKPMRSLVWPSVARDRRAQGHVVCANLT